MSAETIEIVSILQQLPLALVMGLVKAWAMVALVGLAGYFFIDRM